MQRPAGSAAGVAPWWLPGFPYTLDPATCHQSASGSLRRWLISYAQDRVLLAVLLLCFPGGCLLEQPLQLSAGVACTGIQVAAPARQRPAGLGFVDLLLLEESLQLLAGLAGTAVTIAAPACQRWLAVSCSATICSCLLTQQQSSQEQAPFAVTSSLQQLHGRVISSVVSCCRQLTWWALAAAAPPMFAGSDPRLQFLQGKQVLCTPQLHS